MEEDEEEKEEKEEERKERIEEKGRRNMNRNDYEAVEDVVMKQIKQKMEK